MPTFRNTLSVPSSYTHPPMKMEQTECSKTSAYKIQMLGNYPEESIQHSEHGASLKSRMTKCFCVMLYFVYSILCVCVMYNFITAVDKYNGTRVSMDIIISSPDCVYWPSDSVV